MVILNYVFITFILVATIKDINFDCIILASPKILIKIELLNFYQRFLLVTGEI